MNKSSPEALYLIALLNEHHGSGWVNASPEGEPGYIRAVRTGGGFVTMQARWNGGEPQYFVLSAPADIRETLRLNPIRRVSP